MIMHQDKKELLAHLLNSLNTCPAEWRWNDEKKYYIIHKSGVSLWIPGGIHVYHPKEIKFNWWSNRRLGRAFRRWKKCHGNSEALATEMKNCRNTIALLTTGRYS